LNRFFAIHDKLGVRNYTNNQLPLKMGSAKAAHILLPSAEGTAAYIADHQGHLYLQPAASGLPVFHNEKLIHASVWIKSGDSSRIGDQLVTYTFVGDRVEIRVADESALEVLTPPEQPLPESAKKNNEIEILPRVAAVTKQSERRISFVTWFLVGFFLLLIAAAIFILNARAFYIEITPEADEMSISGFPPVLKIGSRFLALRGSYTISAKKTGYYDLTAALEIGDQAQQKLHFNLEKLPGLLAIHSLPIAKADVFIDDKLIGKTPLAEVEISAGKHTLRLHKERYLPLQNTIIVEGLGHKQLLEYTLQPEWGAVTLTTEPTGAAVRIADKDYGMTPLTLELMAGEYVLIFNKQGFAEHQRTIKISPGAQLTLPLVELRQAPATVTVTSKPVGATITVDNVYQGQTPMQLHVSPNNRHSIVLSMPGYQSAKQQLTLQPGAGKKLALTLQPEYGTVFITSNPPDADLYIHGKKHGKATGRFRLSTQKHTLEARMPGYNSKTIVVTPSKDYSQRIDFQLERSNSATAAVIATAHSAAKTKPANFRSMIALGPAKFRMGASNRETGRRANEQEYDVQITRAFYLGAKEVTNVEFKRFQPTHDSGIYAGQTLSADNQPVVNVTWEDAARYSNWLSRQEGFEPFYREENATMVAVKPLTNGYRLPFEAEWALAARMAGRQQRARYSWDGNFPPKGKVGNYADQSAQTLMSVVISGYNDGFPVTAPVASFTVNPAGFFDMGGNAAEWNHDFYTPNPGSGKQLLVDPTGPDSGTHHVVRGASWKDASISELRLSYRGYSRKAQNDIGFRIARFAP
jgi:formylglycine-generating enzyme required for sulfatase activity